MKVGEIWKLHDDAALRRIDEAAVRLLARGGCRVDHEGLLAKLEGAGWRVDESSMRCFFPEKFVRGAIAHLGGHADQAVEIQSGWNPQNHLPLGGSFPHLLDWPSGRRRLAAKQDVVDMANMGHELPEFRKIGRVITCSKVDPGIEPLWATLDIARTTDKPVGEGKCTSSGP